MIEIFLFLDKICSKSSAADLSYRGKGLNIDKILFELKTRGFTLNRHEQDEDQNHSYLKMFVTRVESITTEKWVLKPRTENLSLKPTNGKSVFKTTNRKSVFKTTNGKSVFKTMNRKSVSIILPFKRDERDTRFYPG